MKPTSRINKLVLLNQSYPMITSYRAALRVGFQVGAFVFLFLYIFQPFGLGYSIEYKALKIGGYGVITFLVTVVLLSAKRTFFHEPNWKTWKQIIFSFILVTAIAYGNLLYTNSYIQGSRLSIVDFMCFTSSVALFPIGLFFVLNQRQLDKNHTKASNEINQSLPIPPNLIKLAKPRIMIKTTDHLMMGLDQESILFVESSGNYLLFYQIVGSIVKVHKIRGTITKTLGELDPSFFQKIHRAYIVNIKYIEKVTGNAQGLKLRLANDVPEVPVSRNFVRTFKEKMANH